ncbi:unnamed protein product [Bemisia tabaci]|uniref:Uncharacterized protein n=1 Tax=Bemisia tabaci TaxID=7038 RepID=A0A9P0A7Y6_BEMTA|nr:unnamed protein product [Bemisia tabaci]
MAAKYSFSVLALLAVQVCVALSADCPSFREFFGNCRRDSPKFDDCLLFALNKARPCLQYGDPSLNIPILEPIKYAEHAAPFHGDTSYAGLYSLSVTLPNITEWGWANSTYTKVKSDFNRGKLVVYQEVPFKHVISGVQASGDFLGVPLGDRTGDMVLDMYGVKQRYTLQLIPGTDKIKVSLIVLSVRDVKLQLYNFTEDAFIEGVINRALSRFWRIGYDVVKMFAYELSDQAKTALANKLFTTVDLKSLLTKPSKF